MARAYGPRAIGVVLSGSRDDGAAGLARIAARGGTTVVQDPSDALYPWMPRAALTRVGTADHVVPAAKLGGLIAEITAMDLPVPATPSQADPMLDAEVAMSELSAITTDELATPAAGYGCPSCGGSLFEMEDRPVPRYRCRVGHAWSPESLLDEQAVALEGALWIALRALEGEDRTDPAHGGHRPAVPLLHGRPIPAHRRRCRGGRAIIRGLVDRLGATVPESTPDVR